MCVPGHPALNTQIQELTQPEAMQKEVLAKQAGISTISQCHPGPQLHVMWDTDLLHRTSPASLRLGALCCPVSYCTHSLLIDTQSQHSAVPI